ncbi:MAG: FMN-binding protein, partial [Solobacterium sp.]|nr:FMN-binding protein [Solobacterium sp.]
IYACKAHGFEGVNEATVTVDVASKSVKSIEVTKFGDTESVGDQATKAAELEKYKGVTLESKVDSTTGATFTSTSLRAMITTALQAATK